MVKVSVIVPVYNCERYIDRCMESLMEQTCKDFEVLLMVGFCKDDSLNKCLEWQKKDDRIVVVSRKDTSLGDARNYALKMAKGTYIAYLDADDYYHANYIEKMCMPLEQDDTIDITCCGYNCFDEKQILPGEIPLKEGSVTLSFREYMDVIPAAAVWLKLFRREWMLKNCLEMFDGCCEDHSLNFVLAALVKRVYLIKEPLYYYNIGNDGSLVKTLKSRLDYAQATEYAIKYLEKRDLYLENRNDFRNKVCFVYKSFLQETNNNERLILVCKQFLEQYFPEVIEEEKIYRSRDIRIKDKVILYGAGADGEHFLRCEGSGGIAYIVDCNPILQGKEKYGLKIKSVEELYRESDEVTVIVASSRYYYEIARDLRQKNICNLCTPEDFANINRKNVGI